MRTLAAAILTLVVVACSPSAAATGGPSAASVPPPVAASGSSLAPETAMPSSTAATASETPSAAPPTPEPVGTVEVIPPSSAIRVAVAELNLRAEPSTSAKRLKILKKGAILVVSPTPWGFVGFGPVRRNGYTWYPVLVAQPTGSGGGLPPLPASPFPPGSEADGGWVAIDDGSKAFVEAVPARCPDVVSLEAVQAMLPAEHLACFHAPIRLKGTYGCGGCGGTGSIVAKPAWLADMLDFDFLSVKPSERIGPVTVHFPPDGQGRPTEGSIIDAVVHVDDPASERCRISDVATDPVTVIAPETALLYCRERFVVESYEVLGTDPDFPG